MTRCTGAICAAALFVLMGPASMAEAGGTTAFGTNPGGKYINRGGAMFGTNPGGKYVYSGSGAVALISTRHNTVATTKVPNKSARSLCRFGRRAVRHPRFYLC